MPGLVEHIPAGGISYRRPGFPPAPTRWATAAPSLARKAPRATHKQLEESHPAAPGDVHHVHRDPAANFLTAYRSATGGHLAGSCPRLQR